MSQNEAAAPPQHIPGGPGAPQVPEPTFAERVRTLFSITSLGTLATVSRRQPGFPFGSLMPFALDGAGRPILLISSMAMHTQNLKSDPRCSLFVVQTSIDGDPVGAARATMVGQAEQVIEQETAAARGIYLAAHPASRHWVDFPDFNFYRLQPVDLYYVGGFGVMGWVDANEYAGAAADPLAPFASGILDHMNADHMDSMILLARRHAGMEATEAAMTSVARLGFTLRLRTGDSMKGTRINFRREVRTPQDTRQELIEMVRHASRGAA